MSQHDHTHDHHAVPSDPAAADATRPPKQEQEPASTEIVEVAPGILRTQLPISMPGLGHVNCYVMEDERGIAIMDPGLPGEESWNALVDRLTRAGYSIDDVHTAVVTHSHPDHFGGAIRLRAETDADILTHESFRLAWDLGELDDDEDSDNLDLNTAEGRDEAIERFFERRNPWGGKRESPPPEFIQRVREARRHGGTTSMTPEPTIAVVDQQTVKLARREWIALHTPGHTYDHLCLYDPEHGVVFTGDHVLPSITPHISGLTPQADPLAEFFDSLRRMTALGDVSIALPAHGHPFADIAGRADHIILHHEERLDTLRAAGQHLPHGTVNDYMKVLFRERSWGDMAESETYAHLEHLRELGEMRRDDESGLARYTPVG
jgi:glyoxylase-like metal-dependent hydrolase (beta-lactamase superfamily II)